MNITTDSAQEVWHKLVKPGAYEWWYFDAEDQQQDISVVFIWFSGFAFSPFYMRHYDQWRGRQRPDSPRPDQYDGFNFQLYEKGREVVNFIKEGRDVLSGLNTEGIGIRFERNGFSYDQDRDEYQLSIEFEFPVRHLKVKGTFTFRPTHRYEYRRKNDCHPGNGHHHEWLLCVPKADVDGALSIEGPGSGEQRTVSINGPGYHDHNLGSMPMHEYFKRWYWGRAFSERFDLVYYVIFFRSQRCDPLAVFMLNDNENGRKQVVEEVRFSEKILKRGVFAPLHGRLLKLESERVNIGISHRQVLDAGPFYLRFASDFSVSVDGERVDGMSGISEFLDPSALTSPLMRFFTASRILRDGETTAMYRYYNFFKHHFDWLNRKKF